MPLWRPPGTPDSNRDPTKGSTRGRLGLRGASTSRDLGATTSVTTEPVKPLRLTLTDRAGLRGGFLGGNARSLDHQVRPPASQETPRLRLWSAGEQIACARLSSGWGSPSRQETVMKRLRRARREWQEIERYRVAQQASLKRQVRRQSAAPG